MSKIKAGFLPLYIKLYDDTSPAARAPMEAYMNTAIAMLEQEGMEIVAAPVCRIKPEFEAAAALFNQEKVDVIVTMHLAYSPSLESIDAIMSVPVPVVVLDTTIRYDFADNMDSADIMGNHGIHGVQDLCNLMKRRGKPYFVEAGHLLHGDVVARVAEKCRAAVAAKNFKTARIGTVGGSFDGMGDFLVTPADLKKTIGADVIELTPAEAIEYSAAVTDEAIEAEMAADRAAYVCEGVNEDNHREATRASLAIRAWAEKEKLTSWTVNFLKTSKSTGITKMPFLELSKSMERGMGYAGEGDVLTAGLVGALRSVHRDVTFTEMFCPDWKDGSVFMSHMGEMNLSLSSWRPVLVNKPFNYTDAGDTVAAYGCLRKGSAVLINLAPVADGYNLILAPVEMLDLGSETSNYRATTEGWMKPSRKLEEFLPLYSEAGGTHHSALAYNVSVAELSALGKMMGFNVVVID